MDRYTYTPNLLLNKRLTPPLSPSGRNPSLHPRIISHISRYTKEREREEEGEVREERTERRRRRSGRGKNVWGHSSVLVGGQGVGGSHVWQNRDQRIICNCAHMQENKDTHTHSHRRTHAKKKVKIRTYQMKTCKDWVWLNQRHPHPNTEW